MASEQFILEMYDKLQPDCERNIHSIDAMTGHEIAVIQGIIDDKHSVCLGSQWVPDTATVDLAVLRNVLTSASLNCHNMLEELYAKTIDAVTDGEGRIDSDAVTKWEESIAYYQAQLDAIKIMEDQMLEPLRAATHEKDFYMRGVRR